MNATATTTRKPAFQKYNRGLSKSGRESLAQYLKHDRLALAGKLDNYNPDLGNRRKELSKQCASYVIRLVLNKTI